MSHIRRFALPAALAAAAGAILIGSATVARPVAHPLGRASRSARPSRW